MRPLTAATAEALQPVEVPLSCDEILHLDCSDPDTFDLRVKSRETDDWMIWNSHRVPELLKRIPERKKLEGLSGWEAAATDFTATIIHNAWPSDRLQMTDSAKLVYDYLIATAKQAQANADDYAAFKADGTIPNHDMILHPDYPLSGYQQVGAWNALRSEGFAEFMEQGTGKTAVTIARICNDAVRLDLGRPYRVIIVCPSNVRANWKSEIEKFATCPGKVTVLRGGPIKRLDQMLSAMRTDPEDQFTAVICSYDVMTQSWDAINMIGQAGGWDLAVLDESHYVKSTRAKRSKKAWELRDISARRMCLTGTPIANTPLDLFSQLEFLGKGFSGFKKWEEFKRFHAVTERSDSGFEKLVALQNLPFVQERLARYSFIIRLKEALPELPDKVYDVEECEMNPQQAQVYNDLATHMIAEIEGMLEAAGDNKMVVVNNILVKLLRLAQITSGFLNVPAIVDESGATVQAASTEFFEPVPKLQHLRKMIAEHRDTSPNSKVLIWACFRPDLGRIEDVLTNDGHKVVCFHGGTPDDKRQAGVHAFNHDPETRIFIGNPAAGGTGLNLLGYPPGQVDYETNCDWEIFFSQNWSAIERAQAEARAHRRGTRNPVRITDLVVPGTVDETTRARVKSKRKTAMSVSDLRSILTNVLEGLV